MKILAHRIFTHKKIILIFLIAIFIPLLIICYLSLSTFSKRRETVKKLLESNLWISGEAALKSIEGALLENEQKALNPENFIRFIQSETPGKVNLSSPAISVDTVGQLFLLDKGLKIIVPRMVSENASGMQFEKEIQNSQFAQFFQRAEFFEFSQKNYTRAAELYQKCAAFPPSDQYRANAFEGLGRCLLSSEKYDEANKVYNELSENYGQLQNKAGHPYGIVAIFQLYEIAREKKEEEKSLTFLLNLYKQIREGVWPVNQPTYDFYLTEIESILNSKEGKFPDIQKAFTDLKNQQSPYKQTLILADLLEKDIIPKIKEKFSQYQSTGEVVPERLLIPWVKDFFLVSYATLPDFQSGQTFYGGLCRDLNLIRKQIIPKVLKEIKKDSGLDLKIVDQSVKSGKVESASGESLALAFRTFPLPWKLLVSHPGIKALEKTAQREIVFYGFLLAVIMALMLLGAVLIARDITRETESTRLKTEFVNNISHELKTPLTLIRLYGETLQRKENLTNKERKDCYEIITKESERLSHLINNVLDFSRIEIGRKEFDFKKGYLQDVIRDTLESYRYHLEKKGFAIQSDIARDLPEMNIDGEAIASVLINLLSNAMKFSLKEKEVMVKLNRDNENAILQVADKGIGIPQKEIPKIFQRFYQLGTNISSETRGSGLGLTLVKNITEAHNGKIQVESEPGKGSIFSVILPITDTEKE